MRRITVQVPIPVPAQLAEKRLEEYIDTHRDTNGSLVFVIRANLPGGGPHDLSLSHDVIMNVRKGRDASRLNDTLLVDWAPWGDGPFPHFSGCVNVLGSLNPDQCSLEIDGTYRAPAEGFGELFDTLLGSRIAEASLSDLARRLASEVRTG